MSAEHLNNTQPPAPAPDQATKTPEKGRRKAVLIAVLAVVALVGTGLTAAFTVRDASANNVIAFGGVSLRTIEQEERADGTLADVPEDYEVKATSGLASRIVSFQNAGASDLYVRARPVMRAESGSGEDRGDASAVTEFQMDQTGAWVRQADGWWYYTGGEKDGRVAAATDGSGAGETTAPLMEGIEFVGDFYNVVGPGGKFVFTVEAQAVQADNNGESALDATGWPAGGAQE